MTEPTATATARTPDGAAEYSIEGRVLRVHEVRFPDGRIVPFCPPIDLGVALSQIPRSLWQYLHTMSGAGARHPHPTKPS